MYQVGELICNNKEFFLLWASLLRRPRLRRMPSEVPRVHSFTHLNRCRTSRTVLRLPPLKCPR